MIKMTVTALLALGISTTAAAHGAGYEAEPGVANAALRFFYSVGEPMADTDIVVLTPAGDAWQRGRTDGAGRFSFVPDRDGAWQVVADDGLGHEVRAAVSVEAGSVTGGEGPTVVRLSPMLIYGLLLASLAGNVVQLLWRRGARVSQK